MPYAAPTVAEWLDSDAVREAIADTLMDCRMDGPWWKPPSTLTYQEAMRHYADVILDALRAVDAPIPRSTL